MNNLPYALFNNEFYYKTLVSKQHLSSFQWNNERTKGRIFCNKICNWYSYSVVEFEAGDTLSFNYHPKDAKGLLFIINQLHTKDYVQLMTETNLMIDHQPRPTEMYLVPADKLFTFTYAAKTAGKRLEFFVSEEALKAILSPAITSILQKKSFFILSDLLNEEIYNEICKLSDSFFVQCFQKNNAEIIISLLATIEKLKLFAENNCIANSTLSLPGNAGNIYSQQYI